MSETITCSGSTTPTPTPQKHIGTIVEMDIPVKITYSNAPETIQITIMSNIPNRLSQLQVGDEVDLEGTSIRFGVITEVETGEIVTIKVETEWAAMHRLEVGTKIELRGW